MDSLVELLHTCLGVFGCGCLDEEFWQSRRTPRSGPPAPLLHPQPQAFRGDDLMEELLRSHQRTPPPEPSSLDEAGLQRGASSSSEEMFRAASFNTKVSVLRSQSPFYRMQEPAASPQQQQQQPAAGTAGIELKPSGANLLLGQQHLEARGKFVAAHPVGPARRGASPLQQQQPVAVADGG